MAAGGVDPGRGRAPRRAAAALHGREPRQRPCRRLLRRRAVELGGRRSRHRRHPAFRVRDPGAGRGEAAGRARRAGPRRIRDVLLRLVRAHRKAAAFIEDEANREEVAAILAAPDRIDVAASSPCRTAGCGAEVIRRTLDGRLKVAPDGTVRTDKRYLLVGRDGAARPDPAAGRMALCADGALGSGAAVAGAAGRGQGRGAPGSLRRGAARTGDLVGRRAGRWNRRFAGPTFDATDIAGHLAHWPIKRSHAELTQLVLAALHTISAACAGNGQQRRCALPRQRYRLDR